MNMNSPNALPHISALPKYVPGARGNTAALPPIKLSSNENPLPPLKSIADAVASAATQIHRYPDMFAVELTEKIAASINVDPDCVVVGGGSVAVLAHIIQAYAGSGHEVAYAWRSFEAYPILTTLVGATPVQVPLDGSARHDLPALAAAVTANTRVVLVCSPNNPTGPAVHAGEFDAFMEAIPADVVVVLDEAYLEFVTDPLAVRGADVIGKWPNLVVLRTFSKAYGLAGVRVGYAVGGAEVMSPVRSCVTPFSVSGVAQAAGLAALEAEAELLERVAGIVEQRAYVVAELTAQGWELPQAQGNFVWLPLGDRALEVAGKLAGTTPQILVRPFAGDGIRVSIGTPDENRNLLAALADLRQQV